LKDVETWLRAVGDYRNGTLFFHDTVISLRTDSTTFSCLSTDANHFDARNNIVYVTTARVGLAVLDSDGVLDLSRNWFKPGCVDGFGGLSGEIHDDGTLIERPPPGFRISRIKNTSWRPVRYISMGPVHFRHPSFLNTMCPRID